MTILVYDPRTDTILVDSMFSWSNGRPSVIGDKVNTHAGFEYAATGSTMEDGWSRLFIAEVVKGSTIVRGLPSDLILEIMVRGPADTSKGVVYAIQKNSEEEWATINVLGPNMAHDVVMGAGGYFYAAYIARGDSAAQAVENVARYHSECALPIHSF